MVPCALCFSNIPQESQPPRAKQVPPSMLASEQGNTLHQSDRARSQRTVGVPGQALPDNDLGNAQ